MYFYRNLKQELIMKTQYNSKLWKYQIGKIQYWENTKGHPLVLTSDYKMVSVLAHKYYCHREQTWDLDYSYRSYVLQKLNVGYILKVCI